MGCNCLSKAPEDPQMPLPHFQMDRKLQFTLSFQSHLTWH